MDKSNRYKLKSPLKAIKKDGYYDVFLSSGEFWFIIMREQFEEMFEEISETGEQMESLIEETLNEILKEKPTPKVRYVYDFFRRHELPTFLISHINYKPISISADTETGYLDVMFEVTE